MLILERGAIPPLSRIFLVMMRIYLPRVVKHFCRFLPLPLNGARVSSLFCLVFGFLLCFGLIFLFFLLF